MSTARWVIHLPITLTGRDDTVTLFTAEDHVARVARAVATTETVLGTYAERAAAPAVRTNDPRHVRAGLRAAVRTRHS
ncbi:hypothetical protein ACN27G_34340 [Plantactinospora sp. WMMB334]|uniref:hypothetical protein n=1 Tax=Plantactinospora sp. WMMB334 TaxID=3404119 RepID=UPI003B9626B6